MRGGSPKEAQPRPGGWVPVVRGRPADPGYAPRAFPPSVCPMAYRWNMDYVTDVNGNAMAYYYAQSTNAYAEYGTSAAVSYVRASNLTKIEYGFTAGHAYSGHTPDEVTFSTGPRCFSGTCTPLSSSTAKNWLDVPYSDHCVTGSTSCTNTGPTFWSTVRLTKIITKQWNGSS